MARKRKSQRKKSSRRSQKMPKSLMKALQRLKKLSPTNQHEAIRMANNKFIHQFCAQVKKLKHAKLSPQGKKIVRRHKRAFRTLASPHTGMSKRRRILTQNGSGIVKTLLKMIPIVGNLANFLPDKPYLKR